MSDTTTRPTAYGETLAGWDTAELHRNLNGGWTNINGIDVTAELAWREANLTDEPVYGEKVANDMTGHTRRYQTYNGHTINDHAAMCVKDCNACNGTGGYADEPWYSDGMY